MCYSRLKVHGEPFWGLPQAGEGKETSVWWPAAPPGPTRVVLPKASFDLSYKTTDRNYDGEQQRECAEHTLGITDLSKWLQLLSLLLLL